MLQRSRPVRKIKPTPTPKESVAASHQKYHPAGLWMDPEIFDRMNGRSAGDPRKEKFEVLNRYLQLAALVLGPEEGKKGRPAKAKNAKHS